MSTAHPVVPGLPVTPASALVMAHERLLPVPAAFGPLFGAPESVSDVPALMRGHTVACTGSAAVSCALAVLGSLTRSGSWGAVVGLPSLGVAAAHEAGVAFERTVFVADPRRVTINGEIVDAATVVAALIDGFEIVVIHPAIVTSIGASGMRRLQSRAHAVGAVLLIVGEQQTISTDLCFTADTDHWEGVGIGHGHLQRRRVRLGLGGRRRARVTHHDVWLPGVDGRVCRVVTNTEPVHESHSEDGVVVPFRRAG